MFVTLEKKVNRADAPAMPEKIKCPYCAEEIPEPVYQIHFVAEAIWALESVVRHFLKELHDQKAKEAKR